jgi:hypothetical protein
MHAAYKTVTGIVAENTVNKPSKKVLAFNLQFKE